MASVHIDMVMDLAQFAATEGAISQYDFAVFLNQQQTIRGGYFPTEEVGSSLHDTDRTGDGDAITGLSDRRVGKIECLAIAENALNRSIRELFVDR